MTTANRPLRVIYLEDSPADRELVEGLLKEEKLASEFIMVDRRDQFVEAVEAGNFDLILSDYSLPSFDGLSALKIAQDTCPQIPFNLLSGVMGEERAVESLKQGATDYVLKQRIERLVPSVRRAVREVEERVRRQAAEDQFRLSEERLRQITDNVSDLIVQLDNMLAPIILASQLLRLRVDDSEGLHWLDTMESTTQRGANLIKQVLTFARGDEGDRIETSAAHLIDEISTILKQTLNRSIQIQTTVADDLWPVIGDPTQLHQVLMNLCVNARDAMTDGGRIHVSAENLLLKENDPLLRNGGHPGLHVQITVADTGMGMPADVQERIFDPFYTTKEHGQGSGLGLTTVQTILANHEGFAVVESEQGRGSRFKIFIPAVTTAPITSPAKSSRPTLPRGNGETVLLVDDEAAFREITQATLEKYGYNVLTANDGTEGLTEFMRHRAEISVVITDIMMPVMDGAALIRSLRKMETNVRFIAISGLLEAEKATVNEAAPDANVEFLGKPFSTESLLLIVHEVLSRES